MSNRKRKTINAHNARAVRARLAEPRGPVRQRCYVLVDIENACGTPRFNAAAVAAVRAEIMTSGVVAPDSLFAVGTSTKKNVVEAGLGWGASTLGCVEGQDGGELYLLGVAEQECLEERFTKVLICSGDNKFAPLACKLRKAGVCVVVFSLPESLSRELRYAASEVRYLSKRDDYGLAV